MAHTKLPTNTFVALKLDLAIPDGLQLNLRTRAWCYQIENDGTMRSSIVMDCKPQMNFEGSKPVLKARFKRSNAMCKQRGIRMQVIVDLGIVKENGLISYLWRFENTYQLVSYNHLYGRSSSYTLLFAGSMQEYEESGLYEVVDLLDKEEDNHQFDIDILLATLTADLVPS